MFSPVHERAIKMEMTGFNWLTEDRMVQQTVFGDNEIEITANFGFSVYTYEGKAISSKSLLIRYPEKGTTEFYKPL